MRKLILFLLLLFVGVFTSACVNTYAVKQLNEIAIEYLNAGDVESAISRLEASVDLDANIYESRYNLSAAYLRIDKCDKALENIKAAQQLRKDEEPMVYDTIGVDTSGLANQVYEMKNENGEVVEVKPTSKEEASKMAQQYIEYLSEAVENFDKYTELQPNAEDTKEILSRIASYKEDIEAKKALLIN